MQADCFFTLPRVQKIYIFPHRPTNQTRTTFAGSVTSFVSSHWMRTQIPTGAGILSATLLRRFPIHVPKRNLLTSTTATSEKKKKKKVTSSSQAIYFLALSHFRMWFKTSFPLRDSPLSNQHSTSIPCPLDLPYPSILHNRSSPTVRLFLFTQSFFTPKKASQPSGPREGGPQKKRKFKNK
jgi:hypothetical protein